MKKILVVVAIIAIGFGIWRYFKKPPNNDSPFPQIKVDESKLTEKGLAVLAEIRSSVKELENDPDNLSLICKKSLGIASRLQEIGAYGSAGDWYLFVIENRKKLESRKKLDPLWGRESFVPSMYSAAAMCFFLDNQNEKAISICKTCDANYPKEAIFNIMLKYSKTPSNPVWVATQKLYKPNPEYVKP